MNHIIYKTLGRETDKTWYSICHLNRDKRRILEYGRFSTQSEALAFLKKRIRESTCIPAFKYYAISEKIKKNGYLIANDIVYIRERKGKKK